MQRTNTAKWMENQKRWQINVQKDGERRTFTSSKKGRTGQRECNAKADAWLDDNIVGANERIAKLFDDYIEELKTRTSQSHWRNEKYRGRVWIKPQIGKLKISKINEQHLQNIINKAFSSGLAKKTLMDIKATLSAFFKYCRKRRLTTFRPEFIVIPASAPSKPKNILQPEHLVTLFTVDTTILYGRRIYDDLVNAYRLQVLTGLRPGELIGLKKQDIKNGMIEISRSINIYGEITSGKNDNAKRGLMLNELVKPIIEDQLKRTDSDYLFGEITQNKYRKRWEKYCSVNGIPYITPYEIRHTFVSIAQILPEALVKAVVGHSKSMDTFGVYGHEFGNQSKNASDMLADVFHKILDDKNPSNN